MFKKNEKRPFISTNRPVPPKEEKKIISTNRLDADGKLIPEQQYYDKQKTIPKVFLTTGDVALSESEEGDKKRAEVMEEIRKEKEKKE